METAFPDVVVSGCFFHFTQNIWRRIQANGLQDRYEQDPAFVTEVRMIAALAFVSGNDVNNMFGLLNLDQGLDPPVQVAPHPIGRTDIDQRLFAGQTMAIAETDDAAMFQKPPHD